VRAKREEILDLFHKWLAEGTLIRCQGSFRTHVFSLKARVLHLQDDELRLVEDDTQSELVMKIRNEAEFGYIDNRRITGREAEDYVCSVMVFFGPIPPEGEAEPDSIIFAELKGTTENM
jgi:hypothetical protein